MIDEIYEFLAPRFFDFTEGESEEDSLKAELWFDTALSYAPSPFMPRIKTGRAFKVESLCDFSEADQVHKFAESSDIKCLSQSKVLSSSEKREEEKASKDLEKENNLNAVDEISDADGNSGENRWTVCADGNERSTSFVKSGPSDGKEKSKSEACCTPRPSFSSQKGRLLTDSRKHLSAKQMASLVRNPSALKPKSQSQSSRVKGIKPASIKKNTNMNTGSPALAQQNRAIKRQKLEGGRSRQILNFKPPQPLPHKSKLGLSSESSKMCSSVASKMQKEERKVYVREPATGTPFVSTAEMIRKFQSSTRDLPLPNVNGLLWNDPAASAIQTKLTLTRPKEPELETAQRVRSVRVKCTAELEEEMMAKIPKFKARPLNKKILQAPTILSLPRSTPQTPEFRKFHLETTVRANQNVEAASLASTEVSCQNKQYKAYLTEPKSPVLQTSLRARPPRVKSSFELENQELENIPRFKARPLNKKIFESRGELGIFCNVKKNVTIPQEFHFATDERIPPPAAVADLFHKLSLSSELHHDIPIPIPRNTVPNPFRLHTDERGAEKERKFVTDLMHEQLEEERARIPKANPYPYTTDYPVIPQKPEPKPCTKAEPFQLESLVRHEEEKQREMEERHRMEKEEAQMRIFRAQPIPEEDPIPISEKVRKPLTQVQQFDLCVDHRAVDRAEFDQKVKEKELLYKRYREESEAARMIEEEKALKHLRRTMVPHARPIPKFANPFLPQKSSKETTKAKSPNLRVPRRKERRNMVNAVSSPASGMR